MTALADRPAARAGHRATSAAAWDRRVRAGAEALLCAALVLVAFWWATGGGVSDLGGWASGLTSLGRLTGLLAAVLLLAQVILMSRVPLLEAAFGQDRLALTHRLVGFTSFTAMTAHVGLITWGYAAGDLLATPGELWDLTTTYPGMLLAVAGTACLVLVVTTSLRAARARLRYESWHLLHLYAYLGVGLALPHELWTGQEFVGDGASTARTVFWWTLWAAAAGSVLVWRVGVPLRRSLRHRLVVTSVAPEDDGCVSVYLTGRRLDELGVRAGQFLSWRFLSGRGWTRAHPYSLSAAPDGRSLRITVKGLGDGSAVVPGLRPGTRVLVEGPFGRLTARARTRPGVALIGAGVGVTPLRALAEDLDGDVVVLHRFTRTPLFAREFAVLARERGLGLVPLPGHRRDGGSWLGGGVGPASDLDALRARVPDIAERDVYVCGPEGWTRLVQRDLRAAGTPAERIHTETFGW